LHSEQTSTCRSLIPSAAATARAVRFAFSIPVTPVQALAFPEFAMIALTSGVRRCVIDTRTGAAFTRFVVKVPAATHASGQYTSAMSGRSALLALMPQ
jgi:hypothetical protein